MKLPSDGLRPIDGIVAFAKKVIVIGTAVTIVAGAVTWMWTIATRPLSEAIAETRSSLTQISSTLKEEQRARTSADSLMTAQVAAIAGQITTWQRDRIDLVDVLLTRPGFERDEKLHEIRRRWARDRPP